MEKELNEEFIEQSDHPRFYRFLIEQCGFKVKCNKKERT